MTTRRPRLQIRPNVNRISRDVNSVQVKKEIPSINASESEDGKEQLSSSVDSEKKIPSDSPEEEKPKTDSKVLSIFIENSTESETPCSLNHTKDTEISEDVKLDEKKDVKKHEPDEDIHVVKVITRCNQNFLSKLPSDEVPVALDLTEAPSVSRNECDLVPFEPIAVVNTKVSVNVPVSVSQIVPSTTTSNAVSSEHVICATTSATEVKQVVTATSKVPSVTPSVSSTPRLSALLSAPPANVGKFIKKPKAEREVRSRQWHTRPKEPPERSKMTMLDLIYWNPTENPMKSLKVKEKPPEMEDQPPSTLHNSDKCSSETDTIEVPLDPYAPPAPRLKIGPNGEITIDEESLVIHHTAPKSYSTVTEESDTTYFSFRNRQMTRRWSFRDTAIFYKALMMVGTDFALMANLITDRSRHELKMKFKKEEKQNRPLVDKILSSPNTFDMEQFELEIEELCNLIPMEEPSKKKKCTGKSRPGRPRTNEDGINDKIIEQNKKRRKRISKKIVASDDDTVTTASISELETRNSICISQEMTNGSSTQHEKLEDSEVVANADDESVDSQNQVSICNRLSDLESQKKTNKRKQASADSGNESNFESSSTRKRTKRKTKVVPVPNNSFGKKVGSHSKSCNPKMKRRKKVKSIESDVDTCGDDDDDFLLKNSKGNQKEGENLNNEVASLAVDRPRRIIRRPKHFNSNDYDEDNSSSESSDNDNHHQEPCMIDKLNESPCVMECSKTSSENVNSINTCFSAASSSSNNISKSALQQPIIAEKQSIRNAASEPGDVIVMPMDGSDLEEIGSFVTVETKKLRKKTQEFTPSVVDGIQKISFNQVIGMVESSQCTNE